MTGAALVAGHVTLLADNDTDKGSPLGLFLLLIIAVAVYFLWRSMNRHIKKLPQDFAAPDQPIPEPADPRVIEADQAESKGTAPTGTAPTQPEPTEADAAVSPRGDAPGRP